MTQITQERSSLYDQDILLWVEDTVGKLKAGDFVNVDLANLIEEVESVGISQRSQLSNRLITLMEHLLKRLYVNLPDDYNGWERTIRTQRTKLKTLMKNAPSLKSKWEEYLGDAWQSALENVREDYPKITFPDRFPYPTDVDTLLNKKYWEMEL